jgi:Uma2 family endonuclease
MSSQPKTFLTPEEYLELDRKAERKSEYWAGKMYGMSGARAAHNVVMVNASAEIRQAIRHRACTSFSNDMRVRVSDTGLYTYPDLIVVCDQPQYLDDRQETLLNPTLVGEVLSPSTEAYDRGDKFELYRSIPSLQEYVLIASERVLVDRYTRQPNDHWDLTSANKLDATIRLETVELDLKLADLYEKVDFTQTPPEMRRLHP